jgi:hypothetical protein
MELTVGSKTIPTMFFIAKVQGNYNAILGHDWIHANVVFLLLCINS